jgi:hypothetical protein
MNTIQQALQHYNTHFDNQKYQAIATHLAQDLRSDRETLRVADTMNLLSDVAFQVSGHPHYTNASLKLAIFCGQNNICIVTIDLMADYLRRFQIKPDNVIEDFQATAKGLLRGYASFDTLHSAATAANGIHSWQGRVAYDLLVAAEYLTQAAIHLLMHGNLSYIREKLQSSFWHLKGALHEGLRHADKPHFFDFRTAEFPDPDADNSK